MTPKVEVALCGHATLATAAVLLYQTGNKSDRCVPRVIARPPRRGTSYDATAVRRITFETLSGPLVVERAPSFGAAGALCAYFQQTPCCCHFLCRDGVLQVLRCTSLLIQW